MLISRLFVRICHYPNFIEEHKSRFSLFSAKIRNYDFRENQILIIQLNVIERVLNRNKERLKSKFLNPVLEKWIFEGHSTMTLVTEVTYIYEQLKEYKLKLRPEVDLDDILKFVGCEMFTREFLKVKWTHESLPDAWEDTSYDFFSLIFWLKFVRMLA